jgi:hypothetical protein
MGTTLPGERSGPELDLINRLRQRQGLPPMGGAAQATAMPMQHMQRPPEDAGAGVQPMPGEQPGGDLAQRLMHMGLMPMPNQQQGLRAAGGQSDVDVRERLLRQFAGAMPQPTSREALRRFVGQNQRQALPGRPRRPILPQRKPLHQAQPRPY